MSEKYCFRKEKILIGIQGIKLKKCKNTLEDGSVLLSAEGWIKVVVQEHNTEISGMGGGCEKTWTFITDKMVTMPSIYWIQEQRLLQIMDHPDDS